jgi:sarcosine oxidase
MHAVVVGLGAMGGAVTYHLVRRGARVTALDQAHPPHTQGSSHGETRIIRHAYFENPLYVPLVRRAAELWESLQRDAGTPLLLRSGALVVGPPSGKLIRGTVASARLHEVAHERLTAAEAAKRYPFVTVPADFEVVYEPGAGVLRAEECVAAHIRLAAGMGADLHTGHAMSSWRPGRDGVVVETTRGSVAADALVVCVGSWLPELLPRLALEVERQVVVWFHAADGAVAPAPPDGPAVLWETRSGEMYYTIPSPSGLKAARHHGGEVAARDALDDVVHAGDVEPVQAFLRRCMPDSAGAVAHTAVCRYTNTPRGLFLLAPLPGQPRVHLVSACSGHGFKFASAIGEAVARRVLEEPKTLDLTAFDYESALSSP